jgi:glycosyltransferase involved in cell wall biosynthesis
MIPPLVSVIIPCYRQSRYLQTALESVLNQTYSSIEAILVNDGSDDNTSAIAAAYEGRIRYIYQENAGVSTARNAGIRAAQGDYLLFLDADDVLHPEAIACQVHGMAGKPNRLSVMGFEFFEGDPPLPLRQRPCQMEPLALLPALIGTCFGPPHCYMCSRSMAVAVGAFDGGSTPCEDYDFWLRLAFAGAEGVRVSLNGAFYRRHPESASSNLAKMLQSRTKVLLRTHRHIVSNAAYRNLWGSELLGVELRVRRRWLATGSDHTVVMALTERINELRYLGVNLRRPVLKRLCNGLFGLQGERIVMRSFRLLKPKTFADYVNGYA